MNGFGEEGIDVANTFLNFYTDLMDNSKNTVRYYCSENVILDWFGKTIKGDRRIGIFLKDNDNFTHHLPKAVPVENTCFRDCHKIELPSSEDKNILSYYPPSTLHSNNNDQTPPKQLRPSTSSEKLEKGQGDGIHNNNNNNNCNTNELMSPPKKFKLQLGGGDNNNDNNNSSKLKYITAEGSIEFHRPSLKKMQTETKWKRPCKLHVGFTGNEVKDYTIYLIIYEGNLKCRRNLLREFDKEEEEEND